MVADRSGFNEFERALIEGRMTEAISEQRGANRS
jgi:hypothetical protein